ncbi:MAG TPA: TIGR04133 family radical SAM/SPASM protein [Bacteroidales bacterium]|nr:TIGR04133 family radical SAM/SPASM protein [Bacteroidales bacterium]HPS17393.1 TIGR04133 family radical SAM/SPASM protein [Bacteroidales bacterium]
MSSIKPTFGQKLKLGLFNKYVKTQTGLHELSYLFWECTLRCNINCLHCGSDCHRDSAIHDMPYPDFIAIAKKVAKVYNPNKTMIVLTGGEPLVRKDIEACGYELYKLGFPWGLVSNGYIFTKERFKTLLGAGLRSVTISLDGFSESHNWLRGRDDSWEKAVKAIKLIVKENDPVYDVVTCVNQKNFKELENLRDFLIEEGVKKWRLFTIFPIGRAAENPLLDISYKQFRWLMEFISNTRKNNKIEISYGCEGFLGSYENKVRNGFYFCRAGINIASVLADGSISACPNINRAFVQGNIYKDDFIEVWNNKFEVMRNRQWTKTGICKSCDVYKYCKGNGIHLHEPENENVLRCHFNMLQEACS